jgi:signal transduction histidine kinase/ligand-binding sensor domain-containing protein
MVPLIAQHDGRLNSEKYRLHARASMVRKDYPDRSSLTIPELHRRMRILLPIPFLLLSLGQCLGQFGGPYAVMARDADGTLHNAPGPLSRFTSFHHLAGRQDGYDLNINCILVDAEETYWLGTTGGLIRLDGDRQQHYLHDKENENTLPNDHVMAMALDDAGGLWVATFGGLCKYRPDTDAFERVLFDVVDLEKLRGNQIITLAFHKGMLWCITWDGFLILDPVTRVTRRAIATSLTDRPPRRDGAFLRAALFPSTGDPILGSTMGLIRIDPTTLEPRPFAPNATAMPLEPVHITAAANGRIWCFDRRMRSIHLVDSVAGIVHTLPPLSNDPPPGQVQNLYEDRRGALWVNLPDGRNHVLDEPYERSFQLHLGPVANNSNEKVNIRSQYEDHRGRLWMATDAGLIVLMPAAEGSRAVDLPEQMQQSIMCITGGWSGEMILGTRGSGIFWRTQATEPWQVVQDLTPENDPRDARRRNTIFKVTQLDTTRFFVATLFGPAVLDLAKNMLVRPSTGNALLDRSATVASTLTPDGRLWVGTMRDGVFELDTAEWRVLRHYMAGDSLHPLPAHSVGLLHCDAEGTLWLGLQDHHHTLLMRPGSSSFEEWRIGEAAAIPGQVTSLFTNLRGSILATTFQDGAAHYRPADGSLQRFTVSDGLPSVNVRSILSHPQFGTWLGGKDGLVRIDLEAGRVIPVDIRTSRDHFSGILHLDTLDHLLYIGDGLRLLVLDLDATRGPRPPIHVKLVSVRVNGLPVEDLETTRLIAGNDRLVFTLSLQDPLMAPRTRMAYRLDSSMAWEECTGCRELVFGDISEGSHVLEVRVLGPDGIWSEPNTLARFTAWPTFWRSWWSRALVVGAIAALVLLFFQRRFARRTAFMRAQFARERALSEERLRIANDLHDELGSGLSVIKVKSQLALERPAAHPPAEMLRQVADSSTELIHAMRQVIWTIRSGQPKLSDLLAYMRSYAMEYLADHGIPCTFITPQDLQDRNLTVEQRRALLLILKEALHNVVKHAQAGKVTISITNTHRFAMHIRDNGRGFDPATRTREDAMGLASMTQRAAAIGGILRMENGSGTTVIVELDWVATGPNVPW